jgi:hypothetical protein
MSKPRTRSTLAPSVAATSAPPMRNTALAVFLALCMLGLSVAAMAQEPVFITFDPPGSQATTPVCLNQGGAIVGYYSDAGNVSHGFLRSGDGKFAIIDVPGAGNGSGQGTIPYGNNGDGEVTGYYSDSGGVYHGYRRDGDGEIITFDVEGAGSASGEGTLAANINSEGEIAGYYVDDGSVGHGFVRARNGKITTFDAPGAGTAPGQGTYPSACDALNPGGAIAGVYVDANNVNHGFVRDPDGHFATFEAPGSGTEPGPAFCVFCPGTYPIGINASGVTTGLYLDSGNVQHSFVRDRHGDITTFDAPGAGSAVANQGTTAQNINDDGEITGYDTDANFFDHGWVRGRDGKITVFDAPGAGSPPGGDFYGTVPTCNNKSGEITGYYNDASGVAHGFLRTARCHEGDQCGSKE